MPEREVEIQWTETVETVSRMTLNVPEMVLAMDDPDALTQWVELNVPETRIRQNSEVVTSKSAIQGADLI